MAYTLAFIGALLFICPVYSSIWLVNTAASLYAVACRAVVNSAPCLKAAYQISKSMTADMILTLRGCQSIWDQDFNLIQLMTAFLLGMALMWICDDIVQTTSEIALVVLLLRVMDWTSKQRYQAASDSLVHAKHQVRSCGILDSVCFNKTCSLLTQWLAIVLVCSNHLHAYSKFSLMICHAECTKLGTGQTAVQTLHEQFLKQVNFSTSAVCLLAGLPNPH